MSVVLGHEAYRDGVVGANNKQETRDAVIAHTKMAARMRADGVRFGSFVEQDLAVYDRALSTGNMGIMDEYADAMYDSSGDFWKEMKDGSYFDDGNDGVISFEDGREPVYTTNKGKQGSLEEYLGLEKGMGYELLQMKAAGFAYDPVIKTWTGSGKTISADVINDLIERKIISATADPAANGVAVSPPTPPTTPPSFVKQTLAALGSLWGEIKTGAGNIVSWITGPFKKEDKAQVVEVKENKLQTDTKMFSNKPVSSGKISSDYGSRDDVDVKKVGSFHSGIDYAIPKGTEVLAAGSGTVSEVVNNQFYGKLVAITHDNGYTSYSTHLDTISVKQGDKINGGAVIGTSGNTGEFAFKKYHLHFSVFSSNIAPKLGVSGKWVSNKSVNPLDYLPK
jgi:murein DD-endopeptidase MepM/ murein hydrolase activator NlpD